MNKPLIKFRNMKIKVWNRAALLALLPLLAGCSNSSEESEKAMNATSVNTYLIEVSQVVGVGKVEPESEIVSLAAATGGIVTRILHSEGDSVKRGEPLLQLDDELEGISVERYRNQYASEKSQREIELLNLQDSEIKLANRERLLESTRRLAGRGAETQQNLDDLESEVSALRVAVDRNRASVALAGSRQREAGRQLEYAEAEQARKILRSPQDGILLDLHLAEGEAVNQYEVFAEVAPSGAMTVRTEVDELFADRLKNGLQAEIRYVGSDTSIATGEVIFVSPYLKKKSLFSGKASEQEDRLVREVRIKIDGGSNLILNSKVETVIKL
jgi:multidrug efflux pump subunit AcrA (membrane-fusion protein)